MIDCHDLPALTTPLYVEAREDASASDVLSLFGNGTATRLDGFPGFRMVSENGTGVVQTPVWRVVHNPPKPKAASTSSETRPIYVKDFYQWYRAMASFREMPRAQVSEPEVQKATAGLEDLLVVSPIDDDDSRATLAVSVETYLLTWRAAAVAAITNCLARLERSGPSTWAIIGALGESGSAVTEELRDSALVALLSATDSAVRLTAVDALGRRLNDQTKSALRAQLSAEKNSSVRAAVQSLLG